MGKAGNGGGGGRMLLVDLTPDLVQLLRRAFPGVELRVVAEGENLDRLLVEPWDGVVVDLETVRLGEVLPHSRRVPVVGITSSLERAADRGELAAVLVRPVLGDDLRRTVGRLLGDGDVDASLTDRLARVTSRLPIARLATLSLGAAPHLLAADGWGELTGIFAVAALVFGAIRLRALGSTRAGVIVDLVLAGVLVGVTGGPHSSFLLFACIAAAEAGFFLRPRAASASVLGVLLAAVPSGLATTGQPGAVRAWAAITFLLPCVAVITALARRVWIAEVDGIGLDLSEAHRALTRVLAVSGRLPGGLALPDAASGMLAEAARRWKASAGVVLVEQGGAYVEAGSLGLTPHEPVVLDATDPLVADLQDAEQSCGIADAGLPATLRLSTTTSHPWTLTPLCHDGVAVGALLWSGPHHLNDRFRIQLRPFAKRGGLAIATARRFEQLRSLASDTDRGRLRDALGSDVFQNVISLRYELELLGMGPEAAALRPQLDRLSALARDVAAQVRTTADRMGNDLDASGLGTALRHHCRDLERLVPVRIDVDVRLRQRSDRQTEAVTYELATTAVHRAIATPGVTRLDVRVVERDGATVVEIDDDGEAATEDRTELHRMAAGAAEFGISLRVSASPSGNSVLITAAPVGLPSIGGVS